MKEKGILSVAIVICLIVTSCVTESSKTDTKESSDSVRIESVGNVEVSTEEKPAIKKEVKQVKPKQQETPKVEEPKEEETLQEIGMSPDAVSFLDDSETECTPKYPEGEKALKKLLKNNLRKAGKGEKSSFRASLVVKSDGTVGRVMFSECGYNDEYKSEIISLLQSLNFSPGLKDGKAVDSWYYVTYSR